jgi:hypothetical protein
LGRRPSPRRAAVGLLLALPLLAAALPPAAEPADAGDAGREAAWRVLLLTVPATDVRLPDGRRVASRLTERDEIDAAASFAAVPRLAARLTGGRLRIETFRARCQGAVARVTPHSGGYVPLASDVADLIRPYDESGDYDTVGVFWSGKGLDGPWGIGGTLTPAGNTYFAVRDAAPGTWAAPSAGEIFLHEWLHGAATWYRRQGFESRIPPRDADGGESYGYARSPALGWSIYYRDLMTGRVPVEGRLLGFNADMWALGGPRAQRARSEQAARSAVPARCVPAELSLAPGAGAPVTYVFPADAAGARVRSRAAYFASPDGRRLCPDIGPYAMDVTLADAGEPEWSDRPVLPAAVAERARSQGLSSVVLRQTFEGTRRDGASAAWRAELAVRIDRGG